MDQLTDLRPLSPCLPTLCLKTYPSCVFSSTRDFFSFFITQQAESSSRNYYLSCKGGIPEEEEIENTHGKTTTARKTHGDLCYAILQGDDASTLL